MGVVYGGTVAVLVLFTIGICRAWFLNPPYFNIAEGRRIAASDTCGEGVTEPELYCKLVGSNTDYRDNQNINLIQGQVCDYCNPSDPKRAHPPEHAIDGSERRWMSPPLSRGKHFNEVNLTIDLGQEFHVAYVFIKMGNSPRPGVWILERSTDNGKTYKPWQYFADSPGDCVQYFGPDSLRSIEKDDSVICETKFSKVVPLEGGEIVVSLLNDRPNADNFSYSSTLQEWTKATNISFRFLRTKTLLGHLMSVARQDPTVTRRYFYSIKDINIGGRCVCNGHAETCDLTEPDDQYKLLCRCQHNTCGPQCGECCEGYKQKKWRRTTIHSPYICEPCNCFGHSDSCIYDDEVDQKRQSLDIYGHYEGGGVCQNCRHNTQGINCNQCKPTFYRPYGKLLNATDVCQSCNCDLTFSSGNCADGSGQCECRPEFLPPYCDDCNSGYYGYPACKACDCHSVGTLGNICEVGGGNCPCKPNYVGQNCDKCQKGFFNFSDCLPCDCHLIHSVNPNCNQTGGSCYCKASYGGRQCDRCSFGFYNYPNCEYCSCDPTGCVEEICDAQSGACLCKIGYGGSSCDRCSPSYYGYPVCKECQCNEDGSVSPVCDITGRCQCRPSYSGLKCDQCSPGYYNFPQCNPCNCDLTGSNGITCNDNGECVCKDNFDGIKCEVCKEGFYNYPFCEECNCDPAGVLPTFLGCGTVTSGKLCECKERVTGRICNECKSLFWNLNVNNPLGCEDCNCFLGGTLGGVANCAKTNGQCVCKSNVGSRKCSQCKDGTYALLSGNLFGCIDCDCDVGGSVNNNCDKMTGQCICRSRITGRRCDEPLTTHFFPTLFEEKYEIEDGRTPVGTQIRYGYEENIFPGFSWRGYAFFNEIQKEVLLDIFIDKPSLYQVYFNYLNFGGESVYATVTFTPESFGDIQQSNDILFETTTKPTIVALSGKQGLVASPFVLNPGRWTVSVKVERPMFLDYMVLIPQFYYEATLLQEDVSNPCTVGNDTEDMCRLFKYPRFPPDGEVVRGEAGYVSVDGEVRQTDMFEDADVLSELDTKQMAWLDKDQQKLKLDLSVERPGPYVMVITYFTPDKQIRYDSFPATITVSQDDDTQSGKVKFYECSYSFLCRQVVLNDVDEVAIIDFKGEKATVEIGVEEDGDVAIDSVALVPANMWHIDYISPKSLCVRRGRECIESIYLPIPEATKVDFRSDYNEYAQPSVLPNGIHDSDVTLVSLHENDNVVELQGSVPNPGIYTFVVHYYQPEHPTFEAKVAIQNGDFHEAELSLPYCPSVSGCRTVVRAKDSDSSAFQVQQNFHLNIRQPANKTVWMGYVLAIPTREYHENMLSPLKQDRAGKFITECGQNNFLISTNETGFCRDSTFSLTSEYNNGVLPCQCNSDGSVSYQCDQFGGQCQCRPNMIGRTCSHCKTGYFGFPNCKPCDCPTIAYCQPVTGQCICPPRVSGDRCDVCVPNTYGFDPRFGCEECNCNHLGVRNGNLQCDLLNGKCRCKPNVIGRTCDKCNAGYWAFPHCQLCNCDLRGSTDDICEQDSARCYCKENVYGDSCDQCKPGTFYLEEVNPLGCTKCFCFGTTDRCSSGYLFKTQVLAMSNWEKATFNSNNEKLEPNPDVSLFDSEVDIEAVINEEFEHRELFYFSAPKEYLGNKLSSYGGNLSYVLSVTIGSDDAQRFVGPDIILVGNNITIVHDHIEQPASGIPYSVQMNLVEQEFHQISGREVTREQMMMALVNLERLLIRGSYFSPASEIRLGAVLLDTAVNQYIADAPLVPRVEQCQCPPSYIGNSCENCAPGYYRSKTGPYLGYCIPCQCNGHADSCDISTGKCFNCQHNTIGEHCEMCAPGYHGNAMHGTPYDCLICACPLPIESNNFADSCEVSPSGQEINCNCKPEYFGARCEACNVGYFGSPETIGSGGCRPCQCSGNIDPSKPGSCDSVTGDCVLCLNDTFGTACELCAPGFYGDAISLKNCKKCNCDPCGMYKCDHTTGNCVCWPNVVGPRCERCADDHWGYSSCGGCRDCNCGVASRSTQCDMESGQCDCQPGAAGLHCDVCEPGFWQYSETGCTSCNCDEKYSQGAVCNPVSGICTCLPGVMGDKCDSCPYRWVFVKNQGCYECGTCVHQLLDTTDELESNIDPVLKELSNVSFSYFSNKRLQNANKTADTLRLGVDQLLLDPSELDYSPLIFEIQNLEKNKDTIDRTAAHLHTQAEIVTVDSNVTRVDALAVESLIRDTIKNVEVIVNELAKLSEGLQSSMVPVVDNLLHQAGYILEDLRVRNFDEPQNNSLNEYMASERVLDYVKAFELPVVQNKMKFEEERNKVVNLVDLFKDLKDHTLSARVVVMDTQALEKQIKKIAIDRTIKDIEVYSDDAEKTLRNATALLEETGKSADDSKAQFEQLGVIADKLLISIRDLKDHIQDTEGSFKDMTDPIREATEHAATLKKQADTLDQSLANTRDSADSAVKAANAYANIEESVNNALNASESANGASKSAESMSDGVLDKTRASKERTNELLESAHRLKVQVQDDLEPKLKRAEEGVQYSASQNEVVSRGIEMTKRELDKLPLDSLGALASIAAEDSNSANRVAEEAGRRLGDMASILTDDSKRAKEIPRDIEEARQAIKAGHSYLDRVTTIVPEMNMRLDKASKREAGMRIIGTDVSDKIAKLRKKVAVARTQANRIKLGMKFFDDTTLQLRNPPMIQKAATYTSLSMYFNTTERYGLLAFIGNEKGALSHLKTKRSVTDDYMSLEIKGGYIVLGMDLGSGSQDIKHSKYVSDNRWHQVIVERTGKTCSITVKSEGEEDSVVEGYLPGTYSVFNLDQKISKFFVGGIPENLQIPDTVTNMRFDGCIEEVVFGETPVGLWDFVHAENAIEGCERNELVVLQPSNGLRFSGSGYAILSRKKHQFASETNIKFDFKTFSKDGLLFLIGKNKEHLSMMMEDGHVSMKYDLGSGSVTLRSKDTYNDGKWHSLEASREDKEAVLKVDQVEVASGESPGEEDTLSYTNNIFVGGYSRKHNFPGVSNFGFDGCIRNMQIGAEVIDLNKNKEALGVANGCPVTIARTISFSNTSSGYIAMPPNNFEQFTQLTFKFKTSEENGLLFYSANDDQSQYLLIALHKGVIVMSTRPGGEIQTDPSVKFNDKEWHYVSATKALRQMRLDIDDVYSFEVEVDEDTTVETTTPVYFGGVPEDYELDAEALSSFQSFPSFVGCIGDVTVNNKFQNFADSQDKKAVSFASCPLSDPSEEATITEESLVTEAAIDIEDKTSSPDFEYPEGPEPTPMGQCGLPLYPKVDRTVKKADGLRFGNTQHSRLEFAETSIFMAAITNASTFALEFKSSSTLHNGVMFYVAGNGNIDFIGLMMQGGKIVYVFNCGTGSALITSQNTYNDGIWHRVVFSRKEKDGKLVIDDDEEVTGSSHGAANSVNVNSPFYVGGLPEDVAREARNNLKKVTLSFPGCIRNVEFDGELLSSSEPSLSQNVSRCSDMVEDGVFFSAEGGHLILYDKFTVGKDISIQLQLKPRSTSGMLMFVHGSSAPGSANDDYLMLQLVDGRVVCSVDNGKGAITATFVPEEEHDLCDGNWHEIRVVKTNNLVTLSVDNTFGPLAIGAGGVSSTDVNDPLYIGGIPETLFNKKGVLTRDQFVGCIRNLEIHEKSQMMTESRVFGNVVLNSCPTI